MCLPILSLGGPGGPCEIRGGGRGWVCLRDRFARAWGRLERFALRLRLAGLTWLAFWCVDHLERGRLELCQQRGTHAGIGSLGLQRRPQSLGEPIA